MKQRVPTFQDWRDSGLRNDVEGFLRLAALLKKWVGIHLALNSKNQSLMASRLTPILRKYTLESYEEYVRLLEQRDPDLIQEFISALTTHTTQFFREETHFVQLKKLLVETVGRKGPHSEIRIWCAASSTGQEPYSIAMTALEVMAECGPFQIKILATDIDTDVLERASEGIYTRNELRGVPEDYLKKYFKRIKDSAQSHYVVSESVRAPITFAQFNLLRESYPFKHPFEFVFCRNVLIYFERPTSASVIEKLILAGGECSHLFLGHAEVGMLRSERMQTIAHAVYRRKY